MKKILAAVLAMVFALALLTACGSSMKDGTYRAEYSSFDDHGWKDFVEVTVSSGKITAVDYDAVNEEGTRKSEDAAYKESMEPVSGTYPEKFSSELEQQLVDKQEVKKVDTVAGATNSSDAFKVLATEALKNAKNGKTDAAIVTR
ncbi:FMN-binding protein [Clostridiaceae bacterium NSJ-31]|uniref:FMN-binding protein n=1 Tax=Ligaoa zhengdingensis TaxID=2763658 RepID=A0A926DZG5_9FIRM|nr:FMN-binding protein [Ligaoa zhengdingensis]MBC8546778.1 FMN-binding protein [Ligaoa zhengdingensis]